MRHVALLQWAGRLVSLPYPAPNHRLQPTPSSLRSCVAAASGRG
jgi:hypothetical protein